MIHESFRVVRYFPVPEMGNIEIGENLTEGQFADDAFAYAHAMVTADLENGLGDEIASTEEGYVLYKNGLVAINYVIVDDAEMEFDYGVEA